MGEALRGAGEAAAEGGGRGETAGAVLRGRVPTLEAATAEGAGARDAVGVISECERNVRRKTSAGSAPAATLETLPRDALHAMASHLGVEDQAGGVHVFTNTT